MREFGPEPTYEELKRGTEIDRFEYMARPEPTYEELKRDWHLGHPGTSNKVPSLPMRN